MKAIQGGTFLWHCCSDVSRYESEILLKFDFVSSYPVNGSIGSVYTLDIQLKKYTPRNKKENSLSKCNKLEWD